MPKKRTISQLNPKTRPFKLSISFIFLCAGVVFLLIGLIIFGGIFYPVIFQELAYRFSPPNSGAVVSIGKEVKPNIIHPVDEKFGIVIPKIGANSKVIAHVSAYNEKEYQVALTKGVAQARDTAYPGEYGNTFIFAHSAANWYEANRYNAIFYLLTKLEKKDIIYLFYKGQKYVYTVSAKKLVDSNALDYLKQDHTKKTLTLMTCWPPGTTLKRLIVTAEIAP